VSEKKPEVYTFAPVLQSAVKPFWGIIFSVSRAGYPTPIDGSEANGGVPWSLVEKELPVSTWPVVRAQMESIALLLGLWAIDSPSASVVGYVAAISKMGIEACVPLPILGIINVTIPAGNVLAVHRG
jgi:hypothetical protein